MGWIVGIGIGLGWLAYKSIMLFAQLLWIMLKGLIWVTEVSVRFLVTVFTSPTPGSASSSTRPESEPTTPPGDAPIRATRATRANRAPRRRRATAKGRNL